MKLSAMQRRGDPYDGRRGVGGRPRVLCQRRSQNAALDTSGGAEPAILWMPSGSTDPRAHSAAIERPSPSPYSAPPSAIGMEVINARGDTIGVVDRIVGSVVTASTSSSLGVATHDVALSWPQLRPTESCEAMQLQTTLSNDQLRDLPEFKQ